MKRTETDALTLPLAQSGTQWFHALRGALVLMVLCGGAVSTVHRVGRRYPVPAPVHRQPHRTGRQGDRLGAGGSAVQCAGLFPRPPLGCRLRSLRRLGIKLGAEQSGSAQPGAGSIRRPLPRRIGIAPDRDSCGSRRRFRLGHRPGYQSGSGRAADRPGRRRARTATAQPSPRWSRSTWRQPVFGVLGQPRVNVLRFNLALDESQRRVSMPGDESLTTADVARL